MQSKMNALETVASVHKQDMSSQESVHKHDMSSQEMQVSSHDRSLDELISINSKQSSLHFRHTE